MQDFAVSVSISLNKEAKNHGKESGKDQGSARQSPIGYSKDQKATLEALGLKKMNAVAEHEDNACIRGMINKVTHLVRVLEA